MFALDAFSEIAPAVVRCNCTGYQGFFDNLDHRLLKDAVEQLLGSETASDHFNVYRSLTNLRQSINCTYTNLLIFLPITQRRARALFEPDGFRTKYEGPTPRSKFAKIKEFLRARL